MEYLVNQRQKYWLNKFNQENDFSGKRELLTFNEFLDNHIKLKKWCYANMYKAPIEPVQGNLNYSELLDNGILRGMIEEISKVMLKYMEENLTQ